MQFFLNLDAAEAANQKVEQTGADSMTHGTGTGARPGTQLVKIPTKNKFCALSIQSLNVLHQS